MLHFNAPNAYLGMHSRFKARVKKKIHETYYSSKYEFRWHRNVELVKGEGGMLYKSYGNYLPTEFDATFNL